MHTAPVVAAREKALFQRVVVACFPTISCADSPSLENCCAEVFSGAIIGFLSTGFSQGGIDLCAKGRVGGVVEITSCIAYPASQQHYCRTL